MASPTSTLSAAPPAPPLIIQINEENAEENKEVNEEHA